MGKMAKVAVLGVLAIAAVTSYIVFNSSTTGNKISHQEVDFAAMSEAEIDVIEGVKEKMNSIVPSAQAAE